jgi:hypothetical protein
MADKAIRGASKQIDEPLLVGWINSEDIYQSDDGAFVRRLDRGNALFAVNAGEMLADGRREI